MEIEVDIHSYDYIIVALSGGKDSVALVLYLLELGVDKSKLECWHHRIDGDVEEHPVDMQFDWPCTESYCEQFCKHIGIPLYYTWRHGGFEQELLKENRQSYPIHFQYPTPEGVKVFVPEKNASKVATRRRFPQVSANLNVRWCSALLKVDQARLALRNQDRFRNARTLFLSGERAQESANRARYAVFEPDDADLRNGRKYTRHIDRWRAVHGWDERQVWEIIERHKIRPHPCYYLGWSRCSCAACIFCNKQEFASFRRLRPEIFEHMAGLEKEFGFTVKRSKSLPVLVDGAKPFDMAAEDIEMALAREWTWPITMDEWKLPQGAYKGGGGPT